MLTEQQVLSMSESDYMNDAQLEYFKDQLEKEMKIIHDKRIFLIDQHESNLENNKSADTIDQQAIEDDCRMAASETQRVENKAKLIKHALEKIKNGEYGYCEETGDEIGLRRLMFDPTIKLSFLAQEEKEKKEKHYAR